MDARQFTPNVTECSAVANKPLIQTAAEYKDAFVASWNSIGTKAYEAYLQNPIRTFFARKFADSVTIQKIRDVKDTSSEVLTVNATKSQVVYDNIFDEYNKNKTGRTTSNVWGLRINVATTLLGQLYERARIPEILGYAVTLNTYQEVAEKTNNTPLASFLGATALGVTVYVQQKIIGKNFIKTRDNFPSTFETIHKMWPEKIAAAQQAIPQEKNRIGEGSGMFSLGSTPFIFNAAINNPNISTEELSRVEKRVTRRGSIFSFAFGAIALGAKSGADFIPVVGPAINTGVEVASNPVYLSSAIIGLPVLGKFVVAKLRRNPETIQAAPAN